MSKPSDLPGTWRSLRRAMAIAYRAQPRLLVASFVLVATSWIPDALIALWLKFLADGVLGHRSRLILVAAAGLAFSTAAGWLMRTIGGRIQTKFRELATIEIEAHVVNLQASVATIEHHERPEYLDRLQLIRDQAFLLNHLYLSLMATVGSLARLALTVGLLMSINPALGLLALFAVPTVVVSSRRAAAQRAAEEGAAPHKRLALHLFDVATQAGPGKEVRVSRIGSRVVAQRRAAWDRWYAETSRARWTTALWQAGAWSLFGSAYVAAIVLVAAVFRSGPGSILLVLAAGARLSNYVAATVGQAEFLRWTIDAASRLAWLEDYASAHRDTADVHPPSRLEKGIALENVSFAYPGTDKLVLRDVSVELPAGSVVAIVGENGAGKTTLVKLLARMYEPTEGRITVDGTELSRIAADEWRTNLAGAFQDFYRYELLARQTVGLGDLERMDEMPALQAAVVRGGAGDVVERLPRGLDSQLGPTWDDGVELSFGQWQKLALARGFMRDQPLVLVLDEPTAALDAETEHALFERFASATRDARADGRVTILVSHRFSTVRMADLIVVLDGARLVEAGSHEELVGADGLYAELYGIQARAYR